MKLLIYSKFSAKSANIIQHFSLQDHELHINSCHLMHLEKRRKYDS